MPETIKIPRGDLDRVSQALKKLEPTKERPYEIDGETTWRLAKNETLVDRELKVLNRARSAIYKKHGVVPGVQYPHDQAPKLADCMADIDALEDGDVEITGILLVDRNVLQKKAAIPNSVLAALMPILKE